MYILKDWVTTCEKNSSLSDNEYSIHDANTRGWINRTLRVLRSCLSIKIFRGTVLLSRLAFHVYRLRIVTRIPLPSYFSHIHSADPRPRHHGITLTCQSRLPYVISRLFFSSSRYCPFFVDLVYLRGPVSSSSTSIPRDLFLLLSAARVRPIFLPSCVSSFWYNSPMVHHYCNVLAAILASLSSIAFSFVSSLFPHIPLSSS